MLTRDEIRLIVFLMLAFVVGASVQWRRSGTDSPPPSKAAVERKAGWANPPYVFKSRARLDTVKESLETAQVGE